MRARQNCRPVAAQPHVDSLVDLAQVGERHGYDTAWLPETWGRDGVTVLTSIARETESIGLGPSVLNVYSRSPALLGQTATTLQEVADGRLRMGVAPSGPAVIEGWHGLEFERPLRRTREYIEIMREVMSGETVHYDGDLFSLSGFRLRCDPPTEPRCCEDDCCDVARTSNWSRVQSHSTDSGCPPCRYHWDDDLSRGTR